jgi:uncharacterized membrane protein
MLTAEHPLLLWAAILGGVAIVIWAERNLRWARSIGGPTLGLILAACLSNLRILPPNAPAYEPGSQVVLPVAIALLLFNASLVRILREARFLLAAFALCTVGTFLGSVAAYLLFRRATPQAAEIAGVEAASNIGGSVNFAAVAEALGVAPSLTSALLVVDNLVMVAAILCLFRIAASPRAKREFGSILEVEAEGFPQHGESPFDASISIKHLAAGLALAFVVAGAAAFLAPRVQSALAQTLPESLTRLSIDQVFGNKYVLISLFAVGAATLFRAGLSRLRGTQELGVYLLYVYLFTLGLPADFREAAASAPALLGLCVVVAFSNLLFALVVGRLCRVPVEPLLLTINATVGGPSTAAAMAGSCGWKRLILPGVLIGLLGYAVATPIGVAVGRWLMTF